MAASRLIQTLVTAKTERWLRAAAKREGLSISAWLRGLIEKERGNGLVVRVADLERRVAVLDKRMNAAMVDWRA